MAVNWEKAKMASFDFKAWLKTMPDNRTYNFNDCTGNCAMGQYMTHLGETWDISTYNKHIREDLGGSALALSSNYSFGGLKKVLEVA